MKLKDILEKLDSVSEFTEATLVVDDGVSSYLEDLAITDFEPLVAEDGTLLLVIHRDEDREAPYEWRGSFVHPVGEDND